MATATSTKTTKSAKATGKESVTAENVDEAVEVEVSKKEKFELSGKDGPSARERITVNLRDDVNIDEANNMREVEITDDEIDQLAASIESTQGLLQPVGIFPALPDSDHGKAYELVYGFRRARALGLLAEISGDERWVVEVPAEVGDAEDVTQRKIDQLIENLHRKNVAPIEVAITVKNILDDPSLDLNQTELAKRIGIHGSTISSYLKVARELEPEILDLVISGSLPFSHAEAIAYASLSKEHQKQAAEMGTGLTTNEFKKYLEQVKGGGPAAGDEEGEGTGDAAQKEAKVIRADEIQKKYLPEFEKRANETKNKVDKQRWTDRADAAKFFLKVEGTIIGQELAPWEEELQEKEAEQKLLKEQEKNKVKYFNDSARLVNAKLREVPPVEAAERRMMTLPEAFGIVKANVKQSLAKAAEEKLEPGMLVEGFPIATPEVYSGNPDAAVESFMESFGNFYTEYQRKKKERAEETRKKKEAEAAIKSGDNPPAPDKGAQPDGTNSPERQATTKSPGPAGEPIPPGKVGGGGSEPAKVG